MTIILKSGQECSLDDLKDIPTPPGTRSYQPIPHYALAVKIANIAQELLTGFDLDNSVYGTARDGAQLFGLHTFKKSNNELGLSIAFSSSLDKSISLKIATGGVVTICSNLCLTGKIMKARKHTTTLLDDLDEMILTSVFRARSSYTSAIMDTEVMKGVVVEDDGAYRALGHLFGHKILSPRQMPVALKEWKRPSHQDFDPRTLWSLYNAVTEALKSSPPQNIMERHIQLHKHLLPNQARWQA
ncbi:MAG: hypothetical protein HQ507_06945 [Candidatus Marinimicrobia bacterium]|nr:hypothetical protein [Candidatus Neomarinimicrobiota bacterium]